MAKTTNKKTNHLLAVDHAVSLLIPPSLILLLAITIIDLFFGFKSPSASIIINIFDIYIILLFTIDLYFRYQEEKIIHKSTIKTIQSWSKKYVLDIIATIPFNLIFLGVNGLTLTQGLRAIRILRSFARSARFVRILRFITRAPRFLKLKHQTKKNLKKHKPQKASPHQKELKKTLSFKVILLITINSIMGTGIYFLTAAGAKHAGPASLISWAILAVVSLYIAMCFSELTAMFPKAGGVYEFAKQAYGRFSSFSIGWMTAIAGNVTIAMLLLGALQYLIPNHSHLNIPVSVALILAFNFVAYRGMQTSVFVLVTFALITLATVTALIIPGLFNLDPANFTPFFVFPSLSIIITIFFIAETFFGWESAVFLAAETKNPEKVMPKALIWGTAIIAVLALLLALVGMGVVPWQEFGQTSAPLASLGGALFGDTGQIIFTILVFTSIIGAVACWVVTSPRLLMSVAEDKLFFVQFAKIHPKHKSPYVSIAFQVISLIILVIIGSGNYETLLHMLVPIILIIYSAVLLAVTILRFKKPLLKRPYKAPFGKIGPILTVIFMLFLLFMFTQNTHHALEILKISAGLIVFGIPAYFFIELFYEEEYVSLRRGFQARFLHYFHKIPKPLPAYKKIIKFTGPYNQRTIIVDSNSPMGVISHLIHNKGLLYKKHHIFCSSIEERIYLNHIINKQKRPHKVDIHKIKIGKIPTVVKKANVFISHNDLGHVKNISAYLRKVKQILPSGAKYCFYVTHHFLDVAPNSNILTKKEEILDLFKAEGLKKATYKSSHYGLKEDIFIYGVK